MVLTTNIECRSRCRAHVTTIEIGGTVDCVIVVDRAICRRTGERRHGRGCSGGCGGGRGLTPAQRNSGSNGRLQEGQSSQNNGWL